MENLNMKVNTYLIKKWDGKEYDENGNIINEIKNGNGKIKEKDINNRLIYQGEYLSGQIWNGIKFYYYDYYNDFQKENEFHQFMEEYLNWKVNSEIIVKIFIKDKLEFVGDYLYDKNIKKNLH